VNVHPAKSEVRFRDDGAIHELVRHAIQDALSLRHEPAERAAERIATASAALRADEDVPRAPWSGAAWAHDRAPGATQGMASTPEEGLSLPADLEGPTSGYATGPRWSRRHERPTLFDDEQLGEVPRAFQPTGARPDPGLEGALDGAREGEALFWQLHGTFILTQIRGALVLVDQHNSHERILYDQALASLQGTVVPTQHLLFPATLDLSPAELEAYGGASGELERVGFLTEPFGGNTVLVRGIPSDLRNWNEGALLRDILADLADARRTGVDPREAILASYSCHGAIRAGEKLTVPEMQSLMDRLFATRLPYSCPHGRPTLIRIGLPELERRFGRR
jgi:DNA mismatch repair protein MutL